LKKIGASEDGLLGLLPRWRDEATKAEWMMTRIVVK
jgi:hypothetical protein